MIMRIASRRTNQASDGVTEDDEAQKTWTLFKRSVRGIRLCGDILASSTRSIIQQQLYNGLQCICHVQLLTENK